MVASGTSPPVVQALTVHCAARPRSVLARARATSTQRLTCVVCDTVLAPICELVLVGVPVGVAVGFAVTFAVVLGVTFGVAFLVVLGVAFGVAFLVVGVALGEDLTMARVEVDGLGAALVLVDAFGVAFAVFVGVLVGVVADLVGVAAGLDFSVRVGAALALADAVAELEELAVALGVVADDTLVVVCVGVPDAVAGVAVGLVGVAVGVVGVALGVVGVAVGLVGVALGVELGVCEVGVGEGDGLAGAAGSCSGSQDSPLAVEAVLAAAVLAATVRLAPEASRTLPAMSVTVAGRACAKRIKSPISAARCGMPPTGHQVPPKAPPGPHTRLSVRITATAGFRYRFFAEITGSGRLGRGRQKVNLRIRNVAYKLLVVTLHVRSVFLPGS